MKRNSAFTLIELYRDQWDEKLLGQKPVSDPMEARYVRGAFDDKPFTLGKYESTRIRPAIAELAANGGAPMGFYTNFKDADARRELARYYNFLQIRPNEPTSSGHVRGRSGLRPAFRSAAFMTLQHSSRSLMSIFLCAPR